MSRGMRVHKHVPISHQADNIQAAWPELSAKTAYQTRELLPGRFSEFAICTRCIVKSRDQSVRRDTLLALLQQKFEQPEFCGCTGNQDLINVHDPLPLIPLDLVACKRRPRSEGEFLAEPTTIGIFSWASVFRHTYHSFSVRGGEDPLDEEPFRKHSVSPARKSSVCATSQ